MTMSVREKKDQLIKKRKEEARKQKPGPSQTASGLTMRQAIDQMERAQRITANNPTSIRGELGAISTINEFDKEGALQLYKKLMMQMDDETSGFYNPYNRASNRAVDRLTDYGIDTSNINDDFYRQNSWLRNHYKYSNYTNYPVSPGKRGTPEQKAAYEYYQMLLAEDQTKAAEKEQEELEKYLISEATRKGRTLTDREIVAGIDWNKYPTLKKAREGAGRGAPIEFNRAVNGTTDDWAYATLWRAKNPNAGGDYYAALANSALGLGHTFEGEMQRRKEAAAERSGNKEIELQRQEQRYQRGKNLLDQLNQQSAANTAYWQQAYQNARYSPDGTDRSYQIYAAKQMLDTPGGLEGEQKRLAQQKYYESISTGKEPETITPEQAKASVKNFIESNQWQQDQIKSGAYDSGSDTRLKSNEGVRQDQSYWANKVTEEDKRIEQLRKEKEEAQYTRDSWKPDLSGLEGLFYAPELQAAIRNEEAIIKNPDYTEEQKDKAREKLAELQQQMADETRFVGNYASNFYDEYSGTNWSDTETARENKRQQAYDAINGSSGYGDYYDRIEGMTPEEKAAFDAQIDKTLEALDNPYKQEDINSYDEQIRNAEKTRNEAKIMLDKATAEAKARSQVMRYEGMATGSGEYRPQNVQTRWTTEGDRYNYIPGGDSIDMSVYYANNPWLEEMQELYGSEGYYANAEPHWTQVRNEYFMTPDQVETLNKLYGSGTPEEKENAKAYLEALNTYCLNSLKTQYQAAQQRENARGPMGWLEGIGTIPVNVVAGAIGMGASIAALFGDEAAKDPNSDWYTLQRYVTNTRDERGNVWDEALVNSFGEGWKGVGKFFNGVTYSMADNLMAMATTAGLGDLFNFDMASTAAERLIQLIMSSEATSSTMLEQLKAGRKPEEAAIMALGGGLVEAITEKYSIEALLKPDVKEMLGKPGQLLKFLGKNTLAEGAEEGASDILNLILDETVSAFAGHESEIRQQVEEMKKANPDMTQAEAEKEVAWNWVKQTLMDVAAGSLSGLIMSVGKAIGTAVEEGITGSKINADNNTVNGKTGAEQIVDAAITMKEGTQSRAIAEDIKTGKSKASNWKLGKLAQNMMLESSEEIGKAAQATVELEARKQLKASGVDETTAGQLAPIIAKAVTNGNDTALTAEERSAIAGNQQATDLLKTFFSDPTARMDLLTKQLEATQEQRSIRQQVADLVSGEGTNKASASAKDVAAAVQDSNVATPAEIRATGSRSTGATNEIVYDRQLGTISKIENGKAVISVNGQEQNVGLHEIKAVNPTAAAVISFAQKHRGLISDSYATKALQGISQNSKTETVKYLDDTMKIRLAAMSLAAQPRTSIDSKTAADLYKAAQAELDEGRTAGAQPVGEPGKGSSTYNGYAYGTNEFTEAIKNLPENIRTQVRGLSEIVKRTGHRVNYINDTKNPDIYGWYDRNTGTITINLAGEDEKGVSHHLLVAAGHEMTHWLEQNSKNGYAQLRQFVFDRLRANHVNIEDRLIQTIDNFNSVMKETAEKKAKAEGRKLTEEEISNLETLDLRDAVAEIVANACDQVLGSQAVADELAKTNPSLYNKVKNFVRKFVARIRMATQGMNQSASFESRTLLNDVEQMAKIWMGARDEALAGNTTARNGGKSEGTQFAVRQNNSSTIDYTQSLRDQLQDYLKLSEKEKQATNKALIIGTTPQNLIDIGLIKLPMAINYKHVGYMLEGNYREDQYRDDHIFDIETLSHLPELIAHPVAVISDNKPGTVKVIITMRAISGKQAVVPISINARKTVNGQRMDVNNLETIYGSGDIINELIAAIQKDSEQDQRLYYVDKEKTHQLISSFRDKLHGRLIIPDGYIRSINESDMEVNDQKQGRKKPVRTQTDTIQFQRWFGKSKVKNKDGSPKIMYHGTTEQFTSFDRKKAKSSGAWGRGFYFTDERSHAGHYGNQMEVYLKAEKPLRYKDHHISKDQMLRFIEAVADNEDYDLDNYGYNITPREVLDEVFTGKNDLAMIEDVNASAIGDFAEAIRLFNDVNGTKYDSVITDQETVVYDPTQIKSATDNIGTFDGSNQDIRYSVKQQDARQQELSEAWQKERDNVQELREKLRELKPEMDAWADRIVEAQKNGTMDDALAEYKEWERGYTKVRDDLFEAERRYKEANKAYDDYIEERDVAEEKKRIEASGLSEPEYRRKQAVDHFGYTTDFREAGYLLPNGRMLNFSGEKGRHYGSRGEDHRGIGTIYASSKYQGGEAMMQFMRDGNIRVMAETPGIDIISTKEPTKEQYAAIRNMARRFAGEEYFNVDFTDERGYNADSIEYDGRVNPEKVVNDIKTYFRTGQAPQQSVVSQFHYSIRQNEAYMKAVDEGNMDEAQRMVDKAARQAGYTIRAYHGTGRADRVGTVFLPERATSGPMAYFTDNKEIAENYAKDKKDTSIAYDEEYGDYHTQFRTKSKAGKNIPISQLWNILPTRERLRIREAAKHIAWDDNMENIIFDPDAETGNGGYNEWTLREHKGNAIEALIDAWLDSGDLYNNEGRFLEVLKLAGIEDATWNNPDYREEKVYDTYLKIQNSFNTSTMFTNEFVDGLLAWWEEQDQDKYLNESMGADLWDKNNRTVEEWAELARDNIENGRTTVWTSIPDAVSDYLRSLGHDGIQDQGGKGGGESHTVWIPFSSEQIKSAEPVTYDDKGNVIPLDERFNDENRDIRWSIAQQGDMNVNRWMLGLNPDMLNTEQEKNLLKQYKGLRMDLDIQIHAIEDYTKKLRALEAKKNPSAFDREEMRKLKILIENREARRQKFEDEIIRVTSSEGYAGMMYRNQNLMNALVNNRTADEVRQTVDAISKEIERVKAEEKELAERLNELAANEGVAVANTYFAKAGLKKVAAKLKSDMGSKMKNSDIESRLATTALKLRKGENVVDDVMDLATLLMERRKSDFDSYVLSELRGRTFTLSAAQMAELKGQHRTLRDVQKELAGTGIKVKTGKTGTLDMVWDELCDRLPMLNRDINDLDMLDNLLDVIRSERNIARESQYGSAEQTAGMVMESVMELVDKAENVDSTTKEMISFIREMAGEAKEVAQTIEDLTAAVERMKLKTAQARGAVSVLDRDVGKAIEYFNTLTAQSEAAIWRQERAKLVAQMKSEKTEALLQEQDKWKEKIEKDKAFRESVENNMATRKTIHTVINRIGNRLFAETDQQNIPEEAKPLARKIMEMLTRHDQVYRKITMYDKKKLIDIDQRLMKMVARDGKFDPYSDLDWLVVKAKDPVDNDTTMRDKVIQDLVDIESGLLEYRNARGNREITQRDISQALKKIQEAVSEIYSIIRARNEAFINGKRYELMELAEQMESEMADSRFKGERTGKLGRALDVVERGVGYGNLTPEYFFKNIRNSVMNMLHKGFHDAENRAGLEAQRAMETVDRIVAETGFRNWDGQEKHQVKVKNGRTVEMTTEQIMALYATWLRESNQMRPEDTAHLLNGGFVLAQEDLNKGVYGRQKMDQRPIRMSKETLAELGSYLTEEQKQYVEAIVNYMSGELADLGNETSLQTYGVKKFTEQYYFPIKSWGGVLNKSSDSGITNKNDNRAMRQSFTKRIRANANNAIEIGDFTATAMKHIVGMITFNTVGPAVENMNRVLNQQLQYGDVTYGEDGEIEEDNRYKRNVRAAFRDAYGEKALKYLEKFMGDVNGGMTQQMDRSFKERLLSVFRKNAVAGSLSVALQQPLSYIRAAMMINPKYLAGALSPQYWKGSHAEMLKHSGVAVIKDMGRFDMNQGQSMIDFISPETKGNAYDKITEWLTKAPELMDRMTWTRMWSAVKMEQHALHPEMDINSDEFLDMVGERFNDVMRKTQVYDSMMVKSQNMRSNNIAIKAMTSFMAEPTLSLNVLADAVRNAGEKGGKAVLAKAGATFILSAICQALVKAAMGTGRSPDKKKTKGENLLNKFQSSLIGEADPLTLIPGFSDLIEILKTGELTDDAMSVLGKFKTIRETATKALQGKGNGAWRDIEDTVGQMAQLFTNIPAKNMMRDARAMYNWISGEPYAKRETSLPVLKYQTEANWFKGDNLIGALNVWLGKAGFQDSTAAYYQRIYNADKAGDSETSKDIREYITLTSKSKDPEEAINSALATMAKKDESLTTEQRLAMMKDYGYSQTGSYVLDQYRKGEIDRKTAEKLYKKENPKATNKDVLKALDGVEYKKAGKLEDGETYTNYTPLQEAMDKNSSAEINKAVKYLMKNGYTAKDITTEMPKRYKEAYLNAKPGSRERTRIQNAIEMLYKACGMTAEQADKKIKGWKPAKAGK